MHENGKVQSFHLRMGVTRAKILSETRLLSSPVRYKKGDIKENEKRRRRRRKILAF